MTTITKYRPGYVSGYESVVDCVATQEQLLSLPYVATWARDPRFHRFSVSLSRYPDISRDAHLICELNGGGEWWVVAIIEDGETFGLPIWDSEVALKKREGLATQKPDQRPLP